MANSGSYWLSGSGIKRKGTTIIGATTPTAIVVYGKTIGLPGDSGGPYFMTDANGKEYLAGIHYGQMPLDEEHS